MKEAKIVAGQILVPLKRRDRIEEIIPYIEKIAQAGMRVIFLVSYPVDGLKWLQAYSATMECGIRSALQVQKMVARYSLEHQTRLAEQKLIPTREALHKRGVEIAVDVYTGRLRKVVRSYTLNGDVHLIMQRAGSGHPLINLLRRITLPFGLFKRPGFSPVLLFHPGAVL